jgi:hypothetical protein
MRFDARRAGSLLFAAFALCGCGRQTPEPFADVLAPPPAPVAQPRAARVVAAAGLMERERTAMPSSVAPPSSVEAASRRYVAVRHDLGILTPADGVQAAWKAAVDACLSAGCELLASSIDHDDERRPVSAMLDARLPPAALPAFLDRLGGLGRVGRHSTTADDRTDEVIDTEAKQKNMAEFRDSLRRMLATSGARLKDLIEVERELTRVQSDLDSLATRRKTLANDTDKVRVAVSFGAVPSVLETGMWAPVKQAALRAGHVLARSLATLIETTIALLPWLLVLVAATLAVRAVWRRRRRRSA